MPKWMGPVAATAVLLGAPVTGVAAAELRPVPDVVRSIETVDGLRVTLTLSNATIDSVPNMAAAPLSREGFLSGRVTLTVEGDGAEVNGGQLVVGAPLGCQVNLDDGIDLGLDLDADLFDDLPIIGVNPDIGANLRSGGIKTVGFAAKPLKARSATVSILDAHVQEDECGGVVTARLFAVGQTSTDTSDDSLSVYSEVVPI
ncbi:MspA family porin [Mycolicibacterium phlei]|uniref:MspA family porin n=1 Tax=Mycolicibacterium phlei TaxID=1771 RepID=UPI0037CCAB29